MTAGPLAAVLLWALTSSAAPAPFAATEARALLVGVGQPAPSTADCAPLASLRDVARLEGALTTRGLEGVQTLTGAVATRAGILTAIESHLASAPRGSQVLLHWSGHGALPRPERRRARRLR